MSKLARRRKKILLENSGDDFKTDESTDFRQEDKAQQNKQSRENNEESKVNNENKNPSQTYDVVPSTDTTPISSPTRGDESERKRNLPNCPFCNKDFRNSQPSLRTSHLKSCAKQKGISTTKLLEVIKLERKQAEERKALGLKTPSPQQPKAKRKNSTVDINRRRKEDVGSCDGGADPDLALALALSISAAAHNNTMHQQQQQQSDFNIMQQQPQQSDYSTVKEPQHSDYNTVQEQQHSDYNNKEIEANCSTKQLCAGKVDQDPELKKDAVGSDFARIFSESSSRMWLPQAPVDPPKKRGKKNRKLAPTILETRSRDDRERNIAERIGSILFPENAPEPVSLLDRSWSGGRLCSSDLLAIQDEACIMWRKACTANNLSPSKFIASDLTDFIIVTGDTIPKTKGVDKDCEKQVENMETLNQNKKPALLDLLHSKEAGIRSICRLSKDMLRLLDSGDNNKKLGSGVVKILCKEEKSAVCHENILRVRCPVLLQEMIVEHNEEGSESYIVLSNYTISVVKVMLEYLYGGVFSVDKLQDNAEFVSLKKLAKQLSLKELLECLNQVEVEEVDEEGGDDEIEDDNSRDEVEPIASLSDSNSALDELVSALSQANDSGDDADELKIIRSQKEGKQNDENCDIDGDANIDEEWESFCQVLTQKRRQSSEDSAESDMEETEDGDEKVYNDSDMESDLQRSEHDMVDKLHEIDKESRQNDDVIDLTQENDELSSPDMFAESDCDTPAPSRVADISHLSELPSPHYSKSESSLPDDDRAGSPDLNLSLPPDSPPNNLADPVSPSQDPFPGSLLQDPFPAASPLHDQNPCQQSTSFAGHASVKPTSGPSSAVTPSQDYKISAATPRSYTSKHVSRKRILSSQESLNPRSPKKVKSFLENDDKLDLLHEMKLKLASADSDREACLSQLLDLELTVEDLLATGLGKDVRKLKNEAGSVGVMSRKLVQKWKRLVESHVSSQSQGEESSVCESHEVESQVCESQEVESQEEPQAYGFQEKSQICDNKSTSCDRVSDVNEWNFDGRHSDAMDCSEVKLSSKDSLGHSSEENNSRSDLVGDDAKLGPSLHVEGIDEECEFTHGDKYFDQERDQLKLKSTPVNKRLLLETPSKCTPLPDYDSYLSPELKAELKKYGLKAVPRKKAILFLQHIYDETHPYVNQRGSVVKKTPLVQKRKAVTKTRRKNDVAPETLNPNKTVAAKGCKRGRKKLVEQKSTENSAKIDDDVDDCLSLSQNSDVGQDENDVPEETFLGIADEDEALLSQVPNELNLTDRLQEFIVSRPSLHQDVLLYRPIWLKQFCQDVKQEGIKCKQDQIVDFFDKMCINFRFENRNNRENKKSPRKSPKKRGKKSPNKSS